MPVQANAHFTFTSYEVTDGGIRMFFVCTDPGPGQPNDYDIFLTDAELAPITTAPQLNTLVTNKLNRKIRAVNIAPKLDPFIGQTLVI